MAEEHRYEVLIVGGGPGGLCAGLYAARAERKTVCLEMYLPGGQIALTSDVEDYLGFEHILDVARSTRLFARRRYTGRCDPSRTSEIIDSRIAARSGD